MARYIVIVLAVIALAVELGSCCSARGGVGPRGGQVRVSVPGAHVSGAVGPGGAQVGASIPGAHVSGGVGPGGGRVGASIPGVRVGAGVDSNGGVHGQIGVSNRFGRRRRSTDSAYLDEETSRRVLFSLFDLNKDGQIDVADWSTEDGQVGDLILAHDMDGDEKLSLDEFLLVPVLPVLGLDFDLGPDDGAQGTGDALD